MKKLTFNPKAKTSAYSLYELLTKNGPKLLKSKESQAINKTICDVYFNLYLDESEEFTLTLKQLNRLSSHNERHLIETATFFTEHSSDNSLKTLNNSIIEILQGGQIDQKSIDFIISKIEQKTDLEKMRQKTFVSLGDGVKEEYIKASKGCPVKIIEIDKRKLGMWVNEVMEKGIEAVIKDSSWGDHSLVRGTQLKGKRSVRLSFAGRVVYQLDQEILDGVLINKVTIVRITSNHDYSEIKE
jgi:hypothetical protein